MKIKITHPIITTDRILQAGETIDVPEADALKYIGNEWAVVSAEDKTNDNRKNRKKVRANLS
jgi:hypothetical protein